MAVSCGVNSPGLSRRAYVFSYLPEEFPQWLPRKIAQEVRAEPDSSSLGGNHWFPGVDDPHLIYSGFRLSSLQSAEKYFGLRSSRRAAWARLPAVFLRGLLLIAFFEAF